MSVRCSGTMFVFLAGQDYLEQGIAMAGAKE